MSFFGRNENPFLAPEGSIRRKKPARPQIDEHAQAQAARIARRQELLLRACGRAPDQQPARPWPEQAPPPPPDGLPTANTAMVNAMRRAVHRGTR